MNTLRLSALRLEMLALLGPARALRCCCGAVPASEHVLRRWGHRRYIDEQLKLCAEGFQKGLMKAEAAVGSLLLFDESLS